MGLRISNPWSNCFPLDTTEIETCPFRSCLVLSPLVPISDSVVEHLSNSGFLNVSRRLRQDGVRCVAWSKSLGLKIYVFCQYRAAFRSLSCTARMCIRTHVALYFLTVWTSSQAQSRFNSSLCEMFFPRFGKR